MKKIAVKTAIVALTLSLLYLFGCETIVTDVNAELDAINPKEDMGIPVKYNENYIEVAYNPSNTSIEETEADKEDTDDQNEEDNNGRTEDENAGNKDDKPEDGDAEESQDNDAEEADDEEDSDSEDTEEAEDETDEDGEETDEDGEETDDTENEESNDSDLNASMAEENFDAEWYASAYPDVVAVFGNSPDALYKHYQDYGKAEGRSCNAEEFSLLNEHTGQ